MRLEVDGQVFEVLEVARGVWNYAWVNGPDPEYGFRLAGAEDSVPTRPEHEESIRAFLAEIDPRTGYLADRADLTDLAD